jgi:hypothetical protein
MYPNLISAIIRLIAISCLGLIYLINTQTLLAQTAEDIKSSSAYIWGEGKGNTLHEADKRALKDLISQISIQVESNFYNIITEEEQDVKEYTELVLNTYSATTLNQALRKVEERGGKTIVLRYIERENIQKLFKMRRKKLHDYFSSAQSAESDYRIGDALKYNYWALVLLRSHPDVNTMNATIENGQEVLLISHLPQKINSILAALDISIQKVIYDKQEQEKTILLDLLYDGKPVTNLDYIYYTGNSWTNRLSSCKDGLGVVELFGISSKALDDIRLKIEYRYESKSKIDNELKEVIENASLPHFPLADIKLPINKRAKKPKAPKPKITATSKIPSEKVYAQKVIDVVNAVDKIEFENVGDHFTDEGKAMFIRLLEYGNAELIDPSKIELEMVELNDQIIVRSVPMKFSFPDNNREFIEDVIFTLNKAGKIENVSFALNDLSISRIMEKGERFGSIDHKRQIVRFIEDYKTAYCLGRLEYIESIFADNALILVGHNLKQGGNIDSMYRGNLRNEDIKYIKLSKAEYVERLRRLFALNEFVNIHFEETEIKKVGGDDMLYGIQIAQNYNSASYADFGYLFLMFDLTVIKEPKIYVRSWQPEKNAEGRIMGLGDFTF